MIVKIKIGNVYNNGDWERTTYFEVDEAFSIETNDDFEKVEKELKKQFRIYESKKLENKYVFWVY